MEKMTQSCAQTCFICGAPCESKEVVFLLMFSFLPFFQTTAAVILRRDFVYVWLA